MIEQASAQQAVCVGVSPAGYDPEAARRDLEELGGLLQAAGGQVLEAVDIRLRRPISATLLGKGQIERLAEVVQRTEAALVVINAELSGTQTRNLERMLEARVIDRSGLILDIFALRASTLEGKLQVELAQHAYRLPRLVGRGAQLSRLGGGIGTRGPGETVLETDRRLIRRRMALIKRRLEHVRRTRETQRQGRRRRDVPVVAVVGYTNAGKSTLINRWCASDLACADMLFATLDPALRQAMLPGKTPVMLSDTVGFIRDLPHQLIEAFQATLEQVREADLLLHVIDAADPARADQALAVERVLEQLEAAQKPRMTVFNKLDRLDDRARVELLREIRGMEYRIGVSSVSGENWERLELELARALGNPILRALLDIDQSSGGLIEQLQVRAEVEQVEQLAEGMRATVLIGYTQLEKLRSEYTEGLCVVSTQAL
ncbi:MAG: GTPase HflX [Candidatus Alcyoniella australis]|nr:GTPase HflX [Candidatus Alcyoniella australis]